MKVLFIGGNGNISWHCVQKCIDYGFDVWELNRGETRKTRKDVQESVHQILCDVRDVIKVKEKLENLDFDIVCDFICYNEVHAQNAVEIFRNKTKQYIYISSESVYKRTQDYIPLSENSKLYNAKEVSGYILGKIKAEEYFKREYETNGFPVTIIRPGYTYDTIVPVSLGYNCFTVAQKLVEGYPLIIIGDGKNVCAPLHSEDFSNIFISFINNKKTIGDSYNIVAKNNITLNDMGELLISALGLKRDIINLDIDTINSLNDKIIKDNEIAIQGTKDYIFDTSKTDIISSYIPRIDFEEGIFKTISWFLSNKSYQRITESLAYNLSDLYNKILWK